MDIHDESAQPDPPVLVVNIYLILLGRWYLGFLPKEGSISKLDTGHCNWGRDSGRTARASVRQTLGDHDPSSRPQHLWLALLEGSYNLLTQGLLPCSLGGGRARETGDPTSERERQPESEGRNSARAQGLGRDVPAARILECTCLFIAYTCLPCCSRVLSNPTGTFVLFYPKIKVCQVSLAFHWYLCQSSQDRALACPVQCLPAHKPLRP